MSPRLGEGTIVSSPLTMQITQLRLRKMEGLFRVMQQIRDNVGPSAQITNFKVRALNSKKGYIWDFSGLI